MIKRVVLTAQAQADLAEMDRAIALANHQSHPSFRRHWAGNVKALRGIHPPEFRLHVGDWRVRFHDHGDWIDILRVRNRRAAYS